MKPESLFQYIDDYLSVPGHPDHRNALNGVQVEGSGEIRHIVAAVDASEASVAAAVERGADLLLVHHGLFWGGLAPITGRHRRRLRPLLVEDVAVYSAHLPLDAHAEVGNCVLLARALGIEPEGTFGAYEGVEIGWWGSLAEPMGPAALQERASRVLGGPVHLIPGGPDRIERVGVVTGGGASFTAEAAERGLDALVTGEGSHHTHFDAMELGVHVVLGGHYATEVFGVKALAEHLAERFDLTWEFLDQPTGL